MIRSGRTEEAYHRYGLQTATGPTYLSTYRNTVRRYPDRDRLQVLLDLIEPRGERVKWFAAAKDEGFLDVAVLCALDFSVEPAVKEIAQPLVASTPTEGNRRQGEVFERRYSVSARDSRCPDDIRQVLERWPLE